MDGLSISLSTERNDKRVVCQFQIAVAGKTTTDFSIVEQVFGSDWKEHSREGVLPFPSGYRPTTRTHGNERMIYAGQSDAAIWRAAFHFAFDATVGAVSLIVEERHP